MPYVISLYKYRKNFTFTNQRNLLDMLRKHKFNQKPTGNTKRKKFWKAPWRMMYI